MDELKICPYCGSCRLELTTDWIRSEISGQLLPGWSVWCMACSRLGPYGGSKSEATYEWNRIPRIEGNLLGRR